MVEKEGSLHEAEILACAATIIMSCFAASAQTFNGTLYFTTNAGGHDVHSIIYTYNQTTQSLSLGLINGIADLPGADGIL